MTTSGARSVRLRAARVTDWLAIESLLADAELPLEGARERLCEFVVATGATGALLGCVALERYPAAPANTADGAARAWVVMRSVAVVSEALCLGLRASLVESLLAAARAEELADVTLLTTTAADYFPRFGFRQIAREAAPLAVRESIEFREACPESAVVMTLAL
jgi:N-acetylglutamate synthase-like GNAT family acetyltransferase